MLRKRLRPYQARAVVDAIRAAAVEPRLVLVLHAVGAGRGLTDVARAHLARAVAGHGAAARGVASAAGDAAAANEALGEFDMKAWADGVANVIRSVKADQVSLRLQNEFFEKSQKPLDTKQ